MTQVVRYGRMLKARIEAIRVKVRIGWEQSGSLLAGTLQVRCTGLETDLELDSQEPPSLVAAVVHAAKSGCYAEAAVREATPLVSRVVLNGQDLDYGAYPRRPAQ